MRLRLFPLAQVVLFPGQKLALRVFERRYRQLVAECVQEDEPFGVVLIRDGVEVGGSAIPYEVGTTARITGATGNADGTLNVQVRGEHRFRVTALYDTAPYLLADADTVLDEFAEVNSEILRFARSGLVRTRELQGIASGEFERAPNVAQTPGAVADAIAGQATAEAKQLQAILETTNVRERLDSVLPMLESVVSQARLSASRAISSRWAGPGMAN